MSEVGLPLKMSQDILCPTFRGERREEEGPGALGGEEGPRGEGGDEVMRRKDPFGLRVLGFVFSM